MSLMPAAEQLEKVRHPLDPDPVASSKARAVFALGVVAALTGFFLGGAWWPGRSPAAGLGGACAGSAGVSRASGRLSVRPAAAVAPATAAGGTAAEAGADRSGTGYPVRHRYPGAQPDGVRTGGGQ